MTSNAPSARVFLGAILAKIGPVTLTEADILNIPDRGLITVTAKRDGVWELSIGEAPTADIVPFGNGK